MDQLELKTESLPAERNDWLSGNDPYPIFRFRLIWDGQVVAGCQRLILKTLPRNGLGRLWVGRRHSALLILYDGLTYDRKLLRWATHWRMAAPWLKFALFWLQPRPDLWISCFQDEKFNLVQASACRPVDLSLENMQPDGGFLMNRLIVKTRGITQENR